MTLEGTSSSRAHRDSHPAGTTNAAAGASESVDAEIDDAIRAETARFFRNNRWLSPLGNVAAALVFLLVTVDFVWRSRAIAWFVAIIAAAAATALASSPGLPTSRAGVPIVAQAGYLASGTLWGLVLWLDPVARTDAQFQWIALAHLFAVTAGTTTGLSGVSFLTSMNVTPMWMLAAAAMVVEGEIVIAVGLMVFLALVLPHQRIATSQFRELVSLRTRSEQEAERSEWAALHDALTSLSNRTAVWRRLEELEGGHAVTAMFIDLDHFKEVNDRFGHAAGDDVLVEVAERLRACFRPSDLIARLGGDEFVVVLDQEVDARGVDRLARRAISRLEDPILLDTGDEAYISASIGVTTVSSDEADPERLLTEADHALYRAKRSGRRRMVRFDAALESELRQRTGLETSLRKALRDRTLDTHGQPIFNLQSGRVVGVELLARWTLETGASVAPSVFIPLAEETGLIDDLTDMMLLRAADLLVRWRDDELLGDVQVGLNLSTMQLGRADVVERVAQVMGEYNIEPGRLVIELTESSEAHEFAQVADQLEALHGLGALIAMDDFGTGYSSLSSLLAFPISFVKLDRTLIADLGRDPRRSAVVRAVHQLAEVVGQVVIAEGVETPAQVEELREVGVRSAQGFGLGHPLPLDELEERLADFDFPAPIAPLRH
ncbi:MAG: EAL domain-containing protein [Actinomycetota bacterium]